MTPDPIESASRTEAKIFIRLVLNVAISAFVVDQRFGVANDHVFDLAEEDRVVAAVESFKQSALQRRDRRGKDRYSMFIDRIIDARKLVFKK